MLYRAYEMTQAAISPMRTTARFVQAGMQNPTNPMAAICGPSHTSAALEIFLDATRRYAKPEFGLSSTLLDGVDTPVVEEVVWARPFCRLLHFRRMLPASRVDDPKVLIVAPMSGHYATLLRGTVEAMLPEHDVFITDWKDARNVPLSAGRFDLDDYTDYLIEMLELIAAGSPGSESPTTPEANPCMSGPSAPRAVSERIAILAVCQPGIPVMAAASLMAEDGNPARPSVLVLMGSPIDTACNPKQPNELAQKTPLASFERNAVTRVPWPYRGFGRRVYPGFLQLSSFLAMNLDRHLSSHLEHFNNLVRGDGDSASADAHRRFYDEYLAVMDLPAEFYLQTIERVFQRRLMAQGLYRYRGRRVRPEAMQDIALMTVEGEKDDITGVGQTEAAQRLATGLPSEQRRHLSVEAVGHYGIFNGSRWRNLIQPQVRDFIRANSRPKPALCMND
jgi:poly(3-hydroxybutyrate) depolymerase